MSSQTMTILGSIAAMMAFILANVPKDTPQWVTIVLGAMNSGLIFYLGKTNIGTDRQAQVTLTVQQPDVQPPTVVNAAGKPVDVNKK